jgi:hypothetical protein
MDDEDSGFESQPGLPDNFDDEDEDSDAEEAEIWKVGFGIMKVHNDFFFLNCDLNRL